MNYITAEGTRFDISQFPWRADFPAAPKAHVTASYDSEGYLFRFVSFETDLRAVETLPNSAVYQDSCVEVFMQFSPDAEPRYINIEMNPNGAIYCALTRDIEHCTVMEPADIKAYLKADVRIFDDRWELDCRVPVTFIQKYIPTYRHEKGARLRGNFYKCGNLTEHPHFGCFANIICDRPSFHKPEFFAEFVLH